MANTVDQKTGTITYKGELHVTKGNHDNMPRRTDVYQPHPNEPTPEKGVAYERGHVNASSLGGSNNRDNIAPMAYDVNHGGYAAMEQGERDALADGASISSEKTAYSSNPDDKPSAFTVNDEVTFKDGSTQTVNLSFANMSYAEQEAQNAELAATDCQDEYPNPGDTLRESMTTEEYSDLMEKTDAELPGIRDYYTEWDYQGSPETDVTPADSEPAPDSEPDPSPDTDTDGGAEPSSDDE